MNIHQNHPPEPMRTITCHFIYVNKNNYIDSIVCDREPVTDNRIPKEQVLRIVEQRRHCNSNTRYTFKDVCLFLVDLKPEQISTFSQDDPNPMFLVKLQLLEDIPIEPSIFLFHDLNALYFVFQEEDVGVKTPLKSILNTGRGDRKQNTTKRVSYSNNKTRKKILETI